MQFGLDFLSLQAQFAERVAAVSDTSLEQSLFAYTSLPIRFGVPFQDLVEERPEWQAFLEALCESGDLGQAVRVSHERAQRSLLGLFPTRPQFGCFAFEYRPKRQVVRLHFANRDAPVPGPLNEARQPARLAELRAMFQRVQRDYPAARIVVGRSWLYHVDAYRRLYPPEFTADLAPLQPDYHSMGLWGQFLDRYGRIRPAPRAQFLANIAAARDLEGLAASFPLTALRARADVAAFYRFYGIG